MFDTMNEPCRCALAIFCKGTLYYENPLYRAFFGEGFTPPPAEETPAPVFFNTPFAHVATHVFFVKDKQVYSLFAALPFPEGEERDVVLSRFHGMLSDVWALFSRAMKNPPLRAVPIKTLLRTLSLLASEELALSFHTTGDTPAPDEYTRIELRGLLMALGILLPPMVMNGDADLHTERLSDGWRMIWRGGKPPARPFLRTLSALFCESSGVSLHFEENGFSLFFPIHRPTAFSLRTRRPERMANYLRLGLYLYE